VADDLILIVDDDEFVRRLIMHQLEDAGYRCVGAASAAEARLVLEREACSLMLCDVSMPGESGLDLLADVLPARRDLAVLMVTGLDDAQGVTTAADLGAYGYVVKPFNERQLLINVANALHRRRLEIENRAYRDRLVTLVDERTKDLLRSREETIRRLSRVGEYRDEQTGTHVERVGRISGLLARRVGLPTDECDRIGVVSPLHDIGKVAIPDAILRKPAALDAHERAVTERHAEIGHRILSGSDSPLLDLAATIAWTHHERPDGTGYPRGLGAEEIPMAGRIAAVADVFDALTHERPYRPALPVERGAEMIRDGRGTQFDAVVVDAFLASFDEISAVEVALTPGPGLNPSRAASRLGPCAHRRRSPCEGGGRHPPP
jgi:putative two-component system response regulator